MISEAELPLNERGAVYHLDLLPEELADTVITVGDPGRVAQVSRHFDKIETERSHREFVTHTGYIGAKRLSVLSTGIGVPNIDIVMNELDALVNIDLKARTPYSHPQKLTVIRLGTSGGLQMSCQPGDIYLTQYAVGFDSLFDYYKYDYSIQLGELHREMELYLANESGPFYLAEADLWLLKQFSHLGTTGITATCGGFYGPQGRQVRAPLRFPQLLEKLAHFKIAGLKIVNFEMETAALLGFGKLLGHRCLSLSLALANRQTGAFATNVHELMDGMIAKALPIVLQLKNQ
ncbi:nucleoside phosphorylase [Legionella londiniensis]|uniref:Uridine phosphorylase n=1 Tax=Legionella londiniensis TaxID=45068 RepID=A0A0W0VQS5_9GAMM|nr:nucleoside phosphorylase [Legionella londiniensis]KTD22351.1 purine nucleoside phosphorylase II [Legionella londiniensis]STX93075.1 purine nucleoside phosphorylase II [Legionella londiniensis]